MSWISSNFNSMKEFFGGPSVDTMSTVDPYLKEQVVDPLVGQIGQNLFGTPAQYSQPSGIDQFLYNLTGGKLGSTSQQTSPGQPGSFGGSEADWVFPADQRVPGYQPLQQQYFQSLGQLAPQQLQQLQGIAGGQAPLDDIYNYGTRYASDVITPQVMERFAGLGTASSGGAAKGLARELGNYGLGLNAQMAPLALQNQAQQLQALGQMGDVQNQLAMGGAQQFDVEQARANAQLSAFNEANPYNHPGLRYLATLLGGTQQEPVQNSGGMGYSLLSGLAGSEGVGNAVGAGLQAAIPAIVSMLSDRRAKRDIKPVESVLKKLRRIKVHSYKYVGDDEPRLGLIAQDLEQEFPDAVKEVGGLKHVDTYALMSIIAAALGELQGV